MTPQFLPGHRVDGVEADIPAADEHEAAGGDDRAGRAGGAQRAGSATSFSAGCDRSDGVSPSGTRQAISPRLRSIAVRCP